MCLALLNTFKKIENQKLHSSRVVRNIATPNYLSFLGLLAQALTVFSKYFKESNYIAGYGKKLHTASQIQSTKGLFLRIKCAQT